MKVLLTMNLPFTRRYGGANKSNRILAQELAIIGHEIIAVTPALAVPSDFTLEELLEDLRSEGLEVVDNPREYVYNIDGVKVIAVKEPEDLSNTLKEKVYEFQPDWIFVSSEDPSQTLLQSVLEISPNNVIYLCHTHYMLPAGRLSLYPGEERAKLLSKVSAIVTISDYMKDYVKQYWNVDVFCNHIPHYKGIQRVNSMGNRYVLMINPCAVKGIEILLGLSAICPDVNFAVVPGWGTTPTDVKKMQKCKNITFLNSTNDLNELYSQASVLLMPSIWEEGFGISALDALSRGVPVISSRLGGLIEAKLNTNYQIDVNPILYFKDEFDENNFPVPVYEKQDLTSWKSAVEELLNNSEKYKLESDLSYKKANEFISTLSVAPLVDFLNSKSIISNDINLLDIRKKRELLKILKEKKSVKSNNLHVDSLSLKQEFYDISFAQKQLLRLDEMTNEHYGSILTNFYEHTGEINITSLKAAIESLVDRHEVLRTKFVKINGDYKQKIEKSVDVSLVLQQIDLINSSEKINECNSIITDTANQRFNIFEAPLFRVQVIHLEKNKVVLFLAIHHIISDGISIKVFFNELNLFYNFHLHSSFLPLEPLKVQYKDYCHWQNNFAKSDDINKEKKYWHSVLSGKLPVLNLPVDFPRPPRKTFNGKTKKFTITGKQTVFIDFINSQNDSTLFITLLSFIKILIFKYTEQDDIIVGTPVANRDNNDLQNQIGYYVNMIALRSKINSKNSFIQHLQEIKTTCIDGYQNGAYPFDLLIEQLIDESDQSRSPIFDILVSISDEVINDTLNNKQSSDFIKIFYSDIQPGSSHDLAFIFFRSGNDITINITYNTDLFLEDTIDTIGSHLLTIIDNVSIDPNVQLDNITLIKEADIAEMQQLLISSSAIDENYNIVAKFEKTVQKYSNSVACSLDNEFLSYSELNSKANTLARVLKKQGARPNKLIAVVMDRSIEMIVSIVGILKAGAGYLPIDANLPPNRIKYILSDSKCELVISNKTLDFFSNFNLIQYNTINFEDKSDSNLMLLSNENDLAYVIYTSGTTGNPKGVKIRHCNLMSLFENLPEIFDFNSNDKWALFHSISFDFSVWEIFGALFNGSEIVIIPSDVSRDSLMLSKLLIQKKITVLNQVPGAFYNLSNELITNNVSDLSLRYIIFGGDTLMFNKVKRWKERYPETTLINMYGITETTIHVTYKEITNEDIDKNISNIGKPLKNAGIFILDEKGNPVPNGFAGEIYVFGNGVGDGYINQEILTKEKFVTLPLLSSDAIFYRSGDYGRCLNNGDIQFLGRKDEQVQVRGHRVEIAELDNRMRLCPFTSEHIILLQPYDEDENVIVLYFICTEKLSDVKSLIINYLEEYLPKYMLPQFLVEIEKIPITLNGKIDKKKLPNPFQIIENRISPSNEIEEKLFAIWKEVLNHENFGIDHNFFEIGGHSLKAAKATSLIYKMFQVEIKLGVFFDRPTIKKLGEYIMYFEAAADDLNKDQNYIVI